MFVVAINILIWSLAGLSIIRYGFRTRDALILPPLAMGAGAFTHFVVLFILIRFFPAQTSGWLALALMLLVSVLLWHSNRNSVKPLQLSVSLCTAVILVLLWMVTAGVVAGVRPKERHDEFDHLAYATMIAQAGQPLRFSSGSYINPKMCQQGHYAEGLIVGVLFGQSRVFNIAHLYDISTVYNATTAIGLCFVFLWLLLKRQHTLWAVLGVLLFVTIGAPNWLTVAHHIPQIDQLVPHIQFFEASRFASQSIVDPVEALRNPDGPLMFPRTDIVSFMWYLTSPNPSSFWVVGFLALIGWLLLKESSCPWYWWAGLGVMTALSAVYYTTGLMLIGPIIGFDLLWGLYKNRYLPRSALANLVSFAGVAALFLVFQGGLVTDALLCPLTKSVYNPSYKPSWISFVPFLSYPGFTYYELDTKAYLYNPADWNLFFMAWGLGLFIAPVMLLHAIFKRLPTLTVIIISINISILMPFVILIENVGPNMARIPTLAIWLLGAVSIFLLKDLWEQRWLYLNKVLVVGIVLLMSVSSVANVVQLLLRREADSMVMRPIDYEVQQEWFGQLDIEQDAVFDPHVYRTDSIGIGQAIGVARPITIFGTYGRINGHTAMAVFKYGPEIWEPWYESGGFPGYLTDAGYTYLYLAESDFNALVWRVSDTLFDPQYYQLVQTWNSPETGETRQLFKIVSDAHRSSEPIHLDVLIKNIAPGLFSKYSSSARAAYLSNDPENAVQLLQYLWNTEHGLAHEETSIVNTLLNIDTFAAFSADISSGGKQVSWQSASQPEDLLKNGTSIFVVDQELLSSLYVQQLEWLTQHLFRLSNWWISDRQVVNYLAGTPECFNVTQQTAEFGNLASLKSAGKALIEVGNDRYVCIRLEWKAKSQIERSYKVAAHVANEDGTVVAQYDGVPGSYLAPTNDWVPGQLVVDQFGIRLPDNIAESHYEVRIILYDEVSGERLLLSSSGDKLDSFSIGTIDVMR